MAIEERIDSAEQKRLEHIMEVNKVAFMREAGSSIETIAQTLGKPESTIRAWLKEGEAKSD